MQQIAVIGPDDVARFRPVKVASTDGIVINIAEGAKAGERVALNVPNDCTTSVALRGGGPCLPSRSGRAQARSDSSSGSTTTRPPPPPPGPTASASRRR